MINKSSLKLKKKTSAVILISCNVLPTFMHSHYQKNRIAFWLGDSDGKVFVQQLVAAPVDGVIVTVRIDCTHTSD